MSVTTLPTTRPTTRPTTLPAARSARAQETGASPAERAVAAAAALVDPIGLDEVPRASRTGDPLGSFSEKVRARASESTEVLPGVQR
jgi:hypothetical protein